MLGGLMRFLTGGRTAAGTLWQRESARPQIQALEARVLLSAVTPKMIIAPAVDEVIAFTDGGAVRQDLSIIGMSNPLTDLPVLNSNPGAFAQLYLNFVGDGPRDWWGIAVPQTPAYDIDGDPTTFSDLELQNIYEIWYRVAEMFSPFNINVTTVDPGNLNNLETLMVVIGGDGAWLGLPAGGVAYMDAFFGPAPNVVYAFPDMLANGFPKYTADVIAHEAGHGFGLEHQSLYDAFGFLIAEYNPGDAMRAPIMGVSYYSQRSLWWWGTSIAPWILQNDLAILSGSLNAFGYRADDHGNTIATATPMDVDGSSISAAGIIGNIADVDMFAFYAGAGPFSITANVAQFGAMLDLSLAVYRADGLLLYEAATSSLGETINGLFLTDGIYYLAVSSAGNYGDIGQYTVSGTVTPAKVIQFASVNYSVREDGGMAQVTVSRSDTGGDTLSIDYATSNGTAVAGVDYLPVSGTLAFGPGQTAHIIEVPILDNTILDGNRTVKLTLSNPGGGAILGLNGEATLTILDNEAIVRFSRPIYTVREDIGTATITVTRVGGLLEGLSIDYFTTDGTATDGEDYIGTSGTLVFADGQASASFTITILEDDIYESPETVILTLHNPAGGAILGSPGTAVLRILNYDASPPTILSTTAVNGPRNKGIAAIVLQLNKPVNGVSALQPHNYEISTLGRDGRFGTGRSAVPIVDIQYDHEAATITLVPRRPLKSGVFHMVQVNGAFGPVDESGNYLDGNYNGEGGGVFRTLLARGRRISYFDSVGQAVHLRLRGGGVMELVRDFQGEGQLLRLADTRDGVSILTGRVVGGNGSTTLAEISGADGVRNFLSPDAFVVAGM